MLNKKNDTVLISDRFKKPENWCVITTKNKKLDSIFDKVKNLTKKLEHYALVGIYYFENMNSLRYTLDTFDENEKLEISSIIKKYKIKNNIYVELAKEWNDVGHIENYFTTKQFMLKTRYFNSLQLDSTSKIVTKTSENTDKLINEIHWYQNIPSEISKLIPKIIDSKISGKPFLKLEYMDLPTLAEIWLYSEFSSDFWFKIIEKLFETLDKFNKYSENVTIQEYNSIYFEKTVERVNELVNSDDLFKKIFNQEFIFINGKKFKNWYLMKEQLELKINELFNEDDNCFIHGDLCFSNILYNSENKNFKLIDPRGKWGHDVYGDIKYDIAKIRHSVTGGFDTITNGLYSAIYNETDGIFIDLYKPKNYEVVSKKLDSRIKERWNLDEIKIIEGLLFISMLPLHKDHSERQLALYGIGIQRLNEVLENFEKND